MKKAFFIITGLLLFFLIDTSAQALRIKIQKTSGIATTKTLKFREGNDLKIDSVYIDSDTLKGTYIYRGSFVRATGDSLTLKLKEFTDAASYTDGRRYTSVLPAKDFMATKNPGSDEVKVAIRNIQSIFTTQKSKVWGAAGLPVLLVSLGAFLVSPAICYNYNDGSFNSDLYQTLALSTTAGFATAIIIGVSTPREKFDLRKDWRIKEIRVR